MGNSIYFRSVKTNAIVRGSDLKVIIDVFGADTLASMIIDGSILESIAEPSIEEAIAANNINLAIVLCYDEHNKEDSPGVFSYQDALNEVLRIKSQMILTQNDSAVNNCGREERVGG